jgi:hypothetical protein
VGAEGVRRATERVFSFGKSVVYLLIALMIPKLEFMVWDGFN